jgi:hypothetical protein
MEHRILPPAPESSELERWADEGTRREPHGSNIVTFVSPDEQYALTVEVDDPVHGYLIRLVRLHEADKERIGQTVVDDDDLALQVAAQMAAAAEDLAAVHDRPQLGPDHVSRDDVVEDVGGTPATPEEWDDESEWQDALEDAFDKAEIPRSKGTLTTKTIDDREYYYLQWREGETVTSQYVAPVNPS